MGRGGQDWQPLNSILVEFLSFIISKYSFLIKSLQLTWRKCHLRKRNWLYYAHKNMGMLSLTGTCVSLQNNDIANLNTTPIQLMKLFSGHVKMKNHISRVSICKIGSRNQLSLKFSLAQLFQHRKKRFRNTQFLCHKCIC